MIREHRIQVLHFSNEPVRGGAEEHMLLLLRSLDRSLFRLHLVCPPELIKKFGSDLPDDVTVTGLNFSGPLQMGAALRFGSVLLKQGVDLVHSHMFRASAAASPIARLYRVPVTIETAHVREHWRRGCLKSSYIPDRVVGRFVTRYIAVSGAIAKYLVDEKGLPEQKIEIIANGCDLTRFDPARSSPNGLRAQLGIDGSAPVVVVAARLEPQKGHRVLLEALPAVRSEFPNVHVVCIGDGQLRHELELRSAELGLKECVHFMGFQPNVDDWLALADFTVLPSFYEGLPLVAIESLAAGRAVVATDVDGTPEVIVHEKTGLLVPPGNPERLSEAIRRLLREPELRHALSAAGRECVLKQFSHSRQVQQTADLYLRALREYGSKPIGAAVRNQHG